MDDKELYAFIQLHVSLGVLASFVTLLDVGFLCQVGIADVKFVAIFLSNFDPDSKGKYGWISHTRAIQLRKITSVVMLLVMCTQYYTLLLQIS